MNDYEMMEQRVENLRLELHRLSQKEENIKALKADVMDELLDTRRQLTREDLRRKTLLERESSTPEVLYDRNH